MPVVEEQKPLKSKAKAPIRPRRQVDEVGVAHKGLLACVVYWRVLFIGVYCRPCSSTYAAPLSLLLCKHRDSGVGSDRESGDEHKGAHAPRTRRFFLFGRRRRGITRDARSPIEEEEHDADVEEAPTAVAQSRGSDVPLSDAGIHIVPGYGVAGANLSTSEV